MCVEVTADPDERVGLEFVADATALGNARDPFSYFGAGSCFLKA